MYTLSARRNYRAGSEDKIKRTILVIGLALVVFLTSSSRAMAQTATTWNGAYFANRNLQGSPAFTRADADIDFNWGNQSPGGSVPAAEFSVRWTRWMPIDASGEWTFVVVAKDGVRLFVDNDLVIDAWSEQSATAHLAKVNLTPSFHLVRLEYFVRGGKAEVHLQTISANFPDWRGEYFSNPDLTGAPTFTRNDSAINFNFGTAGPGGNIPGTNFSARWMHSQFFNAGKYRFTTTTDDGVRLWVDNLLVIDQWHDQTPKSWSNDVTLTNGNHLIKMEYFQHGANALATLTWSPVPGGTDVWRGEYFNNPGLEGNPAFTREDTDINFDWGSTAPGKGVAQGTNWSARWTAKRTTATAGFYTVSAAADDGVRVWVDGANVINEWHDQPPAPLAATVFLTTGQHDWRVEYYQHLGKASVRVQIAPGVIAPALSALNTTQTTAMLGEVIVDDSAPSFFKSGTPERWRDLTTGYSNHALALQNNMFAQSTYSWARWYPHLPQAGNYEVAVYIPANVATTRHARYWIAHAGAYDFRPVNQLLYTNQWVVLGTFYFAANDAEYVGISDVTYEPLSATTIAVDAVRFSTR